MKNLSLGSVPLPIYEQIKEYIVGRIRDGVWSSGERVPSENELVEALGVSRMTVNRALRELTQTGLLSRVPGVGTFVAEQPFEASLLELRNIADEIRERGDVHSSEIQLLKKVKAGKELARQMEIASGTEVFRVVLVHYENEIPVQLEDRYVNPQVAPDFMQADFAQITPTEYLVQATPVNEIEHAVEAHLPTADVRKLLKMRVKEPCLCLHRRTWSNGLVASCVTLTYSGSRYQLRARYATGPTGRLNNS